MVLPTGPWATSPTPKLLSKALPPRAKHKVLCYSPSAPRSLMLPLQLSPDPVRQPQLTADVLGIPPSPTREMRCVWTGFGGADLLPRSVHGCLCVHPQEFPPLPSPERPEVLLPVEFDVASMVKPITEILTDVSRLLLEDLPRAVAPKAPDSVGQGKPSAHRATPKGPKSP